MKQTEEMIARNMQEALRGLRANTITEIRIESQNVGSNGAQKIAQLLAHNTSVKIVSLGRDIFHCHVGPQGAQALAQALERNNKTVSTLILTANPIGTQGAGYIAEMLLLNQTLSDLSLCKCGIDLKGIQQLANSIGAMSSTAKLKSLQLGRNQLGDAGLKVLCTGLAKNSTIAFINLYGNAITERGAHHLVAMLKNNLAIFDLSLWHNRLGVTGASTLMAMLEAGRPLRKLNLHDNQLGNRGVERIAQTLQKDTCLVSLQVSNNQLRDSAGRALVNALQTNHALTELIIYSHPTEHSNEIDSSIRQSITGLIQRNQQLRDKCHQAAKRGDVKTVQNCLEQGVSLFSVTEKDKTLLYWAVAGQHAALIKLLIRRMNDARIPIACLLTTNSVIKQKSNTKKSTPINKNKKPSSPFFSSRPYYRKNIDMHWYTHDEVQTLLKHYLGRVPKLHIFDAINIRQLGGKVFLHNLNEFLYQETIQASVSNTCSDRIIFPIHFDHHWTALYIHFSNPANRMKPTATYIDPFGNPAPRELVNAICHIYNQVTARDIIQVPIRFQADGYNCGPWTIANLTHLVLSNGYLPPEKFNVEQQRQRDQAILSTLTASMPSSSHHTRKGK